MHSSLRVIVFAIGWTLFGDLSWGQHAVQAVSLDHMRIDLVLAIKIYAEASQKTAVVASDVPIHANLAINVPTTDTASALISIKSQILKQTGVVLSDVDEKHFR